MKTFRLSVWRPAKFDFPVEYFAGESQSQTFQFEKLQQQIYSWDPGELDIRSAFDMELSEYLREILLDAFAPHLPPKQRDMPNFAKAIEKFSSKIDDSNEPSWIPSQQTAEDENDGIHLWLNASISLLNHLSWILNTFKNIQNASIVIR